MVQKTTSKITEKHFTFLDGQRGEEKSISKFFFGSCYQDTVDSIKQIKKSVIYTLR